MKFTMTKLITLLTLILLISVGINNGYSQNSFGLEFGHNWTAISGRSYDFDSISVVPDIGADAGEGFGGIFYEYEVSKGFSLHNKLNYGQRFVSYDVYNKDKVCQFCPVPKNELVAIASFAFEILPQFTIIESSNLKLNLFAGVNTTFNLIHTDLITKIPDQKGVTSVMNSLQNVVNPVTLSFAYGASIEIWRVILWSKVNPISPFAKSVKINDKEYDFDNSWGFVSFSIGYKFYSLKRKSKRQETGSL
jgi:hypothetical protein